MLNKTTIRLFGALLLLLGGVTASPAAETGSPGAAPGQADAASAEPAPALDPSQREYLLSLLDSGQSPSMSASAAPLSADLKATLTQQLEQAQRKLDEARAGAAGDSQAAMLDLAQEMLGIARARLVDETSEDDGTTGQRIAAAMERVQQRIDELREKAASSPESSQLNKGLDLMQQRLDLARQQPMAPEPETLGRARIIEIYDLAQRRLDEAYAQAAKLASSNELLARLDAAQRRLHEARAELDLQAGDGS